MPGLVYYLSRWYRQSEMTFRISLFIVSGSLAGAFGGLLASAILQIPRMGTITSWRMIFVIEGSHMTSRCMAAPLSLHRTAG